LWHIGHLPWRLLVVGDGEARPAIAADLAALGDWAGKPRAVLLGEVPQDDLAPLYAAADLCVWPAVREAYGMALLEAQACGLPVIAGQGIGVAAVVQDGASGVLVPQAEDEVRFARRFANAAAALLADPERLARMRAAAPRIAAERHDIGAAAARLDGVLRGLAPFASGAA
jgi:glycosyltransferase involved in cell wall biosynthesis